MLNTIEQKVFFPIVRTVALICAAVLLVLVVFGLIFAIAFNPVKAGTGPKEITYKMLENALNPEREENPAMMVFNEKTGDLKTLVLPSKIEEFFPEEPEEDSDYIAGRYQLFSWLDQLETYEKKQDFLNNLSKIITAAQKNNIPVKIPEDDPEAVGPSLRTFTKQYLELKIDSSGESSDSLGLKKALGPYLESAAKGVNAAVKGVILFGVIALFSIFVLITLVLLLISIEKNTRKEIV
ncbi:MAG: hypothetical protein LBF77_00740 [Spirochaetaceae bacterium]|jgi:hypothetical protein|nr:hypothetical protein [Spirochaetaceae bacterium]